MNYAVDKQDTDECRDELQRTIIHAAHNTSTESHDP